MPEELTGGQSPAKQFKTINQLIKEGAGLPALEKLRWDEGQGARQTAFLCYSSGTSGLPVSRVPGGFPMHYVLTASSPTERCHE